MKAKDRAMGVVSSPAGRLAAALVSLSLSVLAAQAQLPGNDGPPAPTTSSSSKVLVADIVPLGLQRVSTARVMTLIKTRVGDELNRNLLQEDVRRLYGTRSFANIQVREQRNREGNVVLYFQFQEMANLIEEIVYEGAKHFNAEDLNAVTGLQKGGPMNPLANLQGCQKIQQHYQDKNRVLATVTLVEGGKETDKRVVFNITEGPVARISSIKFEGNSSFVSSARLHTLVQCSSRFLGLPLGGKYIPAMVDNDIQKLEEYYRGWGFHDVKVSRELQWSSDQRTVKLIFHIHEGRRYQVNSVDVVGNSTESHDSLLKLVEVKPGDFANEGKTKVDMEKIKAWYGYRGKDPMVIQNVSYRQDQPGQCDIQYRVEERPPSTAGQVIIIGNYVTRENVIRRQVPIYPGQVLSYPDLRVAEINLARLNIFENNPELGIRPTVTVLDPDSESTVKDVLVTVQETATGSLLFGLGVNSDAGLTGSIVLNERNFDITRFPTSIDDLLSGRAFRGAGQEFRLEAVPGTNLQRYTASFREPFLFDTPFSLSVSGYYYNRIFNEYTESRLGSRITVGRKLNPLWSVNVGVRVEDVGVSNVALFAPPDYLDVVGHHLLVGLRGDIIRDSRDSYLRPTEGNLLDLSYEQVLGDFTFPVLSAEFNQYITTYQRNDHSGRHVLALHSEVAWAGSQAPVYERFFAGGFRSMRGFEYRGVSPNVNGFMVGGDFMWLNSLEYQIPILANDSVYVVGFVDSGTVEPSVKIENYRVTAGFGVRLVVPMLGPVPIALDFGFPIKKAPWDRDQVFSFWVGFFGNGRQ